MTAKPALSRFSDIASLDPNVTPAQLEEWYGDDYDTFGLLVVAEAVRARVPAGVTLWLSSPEVCAEWEEMLAVQEGNHQGAWWRRMVELGIEHPDTLSAERRLAAVRQRRKEAGTITAALCGPPRGSAEHSRAMDRLKQAHAEEVEELVGRLRRTSGIAAAEQTTVEVARLLAMGDGEFRDLVALDVQGRADVDDLAHPAVTGRWYEALVALGEQTFAEIGLAAHPKAALNRFAVPDSHLIRSRHSATIAEWAPKLTFLTHLRARMTERTRQRRLHSQRLSNELWLPVERHLTSTYFAEYAKYLLDEPEPVSPCPAAGTRRDTRIPPHPGVFDRHKAVLEEHGWTVTWIFDGRRVWLDAWHGRRWKDEGRLIVTALRSRRGGAAGGWEWGSPGLVSYDRRTGQYALLTTEKAFHRLAETNPRSAPVSLTKMVLTDVKLLTTFVPPSGFRWRNPYPPNLDEIGQR